MAQDTSAFIRAISPTGELIWEVHVVNETIEHATPGVDPDLKCAQPLPALPSLVERVDGIGLLDVHVNSDVGEHLRPWINALFPKDRARATEWLITELETASADPVGSANRSTDQEARWVPVLDTAGRGFDAAIVHEFGVGPMRLAAWRRLDRKRFCQAQHALTKMLELTPPGSVPLRSAMKQLQLGTIARATDRLSNFAQTADAQGLELLSGDPGVQKEQRRARIELRQRGREISDLHRLLDGVRHAPGDIQGFADSDLGAPDLLAKASLDGTTTQLAEALAGHARMLSLYTDVLLAEEAAANARFQSIAAVVASVLLAPALVAAVYGANVKVPGAESTDGFLAMVAWMFAALLFAWTAMRRFQHRPVVPITANDPRGAVLTLAGAVALALFFMAVLLPRPEMHLRVAMGVLALALLVLVALADRQTPTRP